MLLSLPFQLWMSEETKDDHFSLKHYRISLHSCLTTALPLESRWIMHDGLFSSLPESAAQLYTLFWSGGFFTPPPGIYTPQMPSTFIPHQTISHLCTRSQSSHCGPLSRICTRKCTLAPMWKSEFIRMLLWWESDRCHKATLDDYEIS